jgi:hypothetical protein
LRERSGDAPGERLKRTEQHQCQDAPGPAEVGETLDHLGNEGHAQKPSRERPEPGPNDGLPDRGGAGEREVQRDQSEQHARVEIAARSGAGERKSAEDGAE